MATPRPPGVRRASVFEERLARAANILPAFRPLKSLWGSGLARSHSLTPLRPHFGSPMLAKRRRQGPLGASLFRHQFSMIARRPGVQSNKY